MSKKVKLVGIEEVAQAVESGNHRKIRGLIKSRKLDMEAVRYLGSVIDGYLYIEIYENYKFEDLFSTFHEFAASDMARTTSNDYEMPRAIRWINTFYETPEELKAAYDSLEGKSKSIFRELIAIRNEGGETIKNHLRDKFINCMPAVVDILNDRYEFSSQTEYYHKLITGLPFIGKNVIDVLEQKEMEIFETLGEERGSYDYLLNRRYTQRFSYMESEAEFIDFLEASERMGESDKAYLRCKAVYNLATPISWLDKDVKKNRQARAEEMYAEYLNDYILKTTLKDKIELANHMRNMEDLLPILVFQKEEDVRDEWFRILGKKYGFSSLLNRIIRNHTTGMTIKPTKNMLYISHLISESTRELLLDKELTTADEIIEFFQSVFPDRKMINPIYENRYLYDNIKLDSLSEEDFNKLRPYLHMDQFSEYFKDDIVPFAFVQKHSDFVNPSTLSRGIRGSYSMKDLTWLAENRMDKMDDRTREMIMSHGVFTKKTNAEDLATLLKITAQENHYCRNFVDLISERNENNLKLNDILTFIN